MAGSGVYARHGFVRWSAIIASLSVFTVSTLLYGLPLAVLLSLLASAAYCCVTYLSFSLQGREGRLALERAYDSLFAAVYGSSEGRNRDKSVAPSLACHREAQKMIRLITRDFVFEWYRNVATEQEFPEDCEKVLEHVALEINLRVQQMDLQEVTKELLAAIIPYLETLNRTGWVEYNGVEIFDVRHERCLRSFQETPTVAHRALRSPESETRHFRQLLDSLLQCALPERYCNCDVTCLLLREVLLRNILEPVLTLVCDPDFLYKAIPVILKKAASADVQTVLDHIKEENRELDCALLKGRVIQAHRRPTQRFHSIPEHFPTSTKPIPVPLSRMYPESFVMEGGVACDEGGEVSEEEGCEMVESEGVELPLLEREEVDGATIFSPSPTSSICSSSSSHAHEDTPTLRGLFLGLPFPGRKSLARRQTLPNISPQQQPQAPPTSSRPLSSLGVAVGGASSSSLEIDPDLVCVELPPIFATRYIHVRHSNSTYIGYVFKFPKSMLLPGNQQEVGVANEETHLESMKRYSDFTRLHQQLQRTPELLKLIKGLDLPEKHGFANVVSKLPFTSRDLDPTTLLERKQGLEKHIQLMSSRQDILESRIFQDFLKSGVLLLRDINSLHSYKSRQRRSLLGMVKGHSDDSEEAQPLPKRPMESVLSSFLNTTLPLPCRNLNTPTGSNRTPLTGKTGLTSHRERRERLTKAATIGKSSAPNSAHFGGSDGEEKPRSVSLTDSDRILEKGGRDGSCDSIDDSCKKRPLFDRGCHGNGIVTDTAVTVATRPESQLATSEPFLTRMRRRLVNFLSSVSLLTRTILSVIRQCSQPFTQHTLHTLTLSQHHANPLSNTILSLATEASRRHCPELWVTDRSTQTAVLTLVGGAIDCFLTAELKEVVEKEEKWVRVLYRLRHMLWVDGRGELDRTPRDTLTQEEREERKKMAVAAFKKFLPNFLPYVVGSEDYGHAVTHCMECLQNPQINRHFFLRVIDILLPKLIPELNSDEFQKRLARLRTLTSTHHAHKTRPLSTYSKKH